MTVHVVVGGPSNKGMKLTRVGAGAERYRLSGASSWIAAQLMPGVRRTMGASR